MTLRSFVAAAAFAVLAPPTIAAQYTVDDVPLPDPDGYQPLVWEFVINDFTLGGSGSLEIWDAVFDPFVPVTTEFGRRNGLEIVFRAPEGKAFVIDEEVSKSGWVLTTLFLHLESSSPTPTYAGQYFDSYGNLVYIYPFRGSSYIRPEELPVTFRLDGADGPVETTITQPVLISGTRCEVHTHACMEFPMVYGYDGGLWGNVPQQSGVFTSMRFIVDTNAFQDPYGAKMYVANATYFLEDPSDVQFQLVNMNPSGTATAPLISIAPIPTAVPIPATGPLALAGLALLGVLARRRKPA